MTGQNEPPLALVTGANRGLGLECARQLLTHGFEVLLGSRDAGLGVMARVAVAGRHHPITSGFGRVRRDHARDYAALRRRTFDIDLAPLPASLALSAADHETNRRAKLVVRR